jgi:RimJ/RimL family protein N-acetyltransferase
VVETPYVPAYPVRTARLNLRPHRLSDLDDLLAFHSDPEVVRYIPWPVRDRDQTRVALEAKLDQVSLSAPGQWLVLAVELRETGAVIGEVLLKWVSATDEQGEIGFAIHRAYHGQGLAFEAAEAMLRLGFAELKLHRIIGVCDADNTASAALMSRLGMRQEAHYVQATFFKGRWTDDLIFAMLADEWFSRQDLRNE